MAPGVQAEVVTYLLDFRAQEKDKVRHIAVTCSRSALSKACMVWQDHLGIIGGLVGYLPPSPDVMIHVC